MDDREGRKFRHLDREVHIKQGENGQPLFSIDPLASSREYEHSWHTKGELANEAMRRGIKGRKLKAIQEKANAQERLMKQGDYVLPPTVEREDRLGELEPEYRNKAFKGVGKDDIDERDFDTEKAEKATAFNLMGLKGPKYSE